MYAMRSRSVALVLAAASVPGAMVACRGAVGPELASPDVDYSPTVSANHPLEDGGELDDPAVLADGAPSGVLPRPVDVVGQLDGAPASALPVLPKLVNVQASQRDDSVGIDFDPFDGAMDYRVYPLPKDGDVTVNADGSTKVKNAIYRCAGLRQTYDVANNLNSKGGQTPQSADGTGLFTSDGNGYAWKTQLSSASPTLGYVYTNPGANRVPVYALAGYTLANELGWGETRLKIYTSDTAERQTLTSQGWRDDGIVFYVPAAASSATATIYRSQTVSGSGASAEYAQYYFGSVDSAKHAKDTSPARPAFQVLTASAAGTQPLMAVTYEPSQNHVELAVGKSRFQRAAYQGPTPLWHLEWSGLTGPTTLVVEALASGCPYQGFLSAQHLSVPQHQTFFTLAELQAASPTGEVFVNGQYDGPTSPAPEGAAVAAMKVNTMSPKALARSYVSVAPKPHAASDWDWYEDFSIGSSLGTVTPVPRQSGSIFCPPSAQDTLCGRWQSSTLDFSSYNIDGSKAAVFTYGYILGQFWEAFDDEGADVTGKVRFTSRQLATVSSDSTKYLHATMSVDMVSTGRRYPQLVISDQPAPVQDGLANAKNNTLIFQSINGPDTRIELQAIHGLVNGGPWDVNNQAPEHVLVRSDFESLSKPAIAADLSILDHIGVDRMTRLDVYVSSKRAYVFLDGVPAGCTQYPANVTLSGAVSVTFGDVLYHEGAYDELVCATQKPYPFLHSHQCTETKRHFDDLAFKSGVAAPAWNEAIRPCGAY